MLTLNVRRCLLISVSILTFSSPAVSQTALKIVDQHNNPLPNAVVEYAASKQQSKQQNKQPASDKTYIMDQINKQFVPHVLIVPKNSLVNFPNSDDIRHHVYSFSEAKTFELKLYAGRPKNPVQFDKNGVVVMGCNIHDSMVGYIYVADSNNTYMSDENGDILLPDDLSLNTSLHIWHPNSSTGLSKQTTFTVDKAMLAQDVITFTMDIKKPKARDSFEELNLNEY